MVIICEIFIQNVSIAIIIADITLLLNVDDNNYGVIRAKYNNYEINYDARSV